MWWLFGGVLALTPGFKHVRTDRLEFDVPRDMANERLEPIHQLSFLFNFVWNPRPDQPAPNPFEVTSAETWFKDDRLVLALTAKSPSSWPFDGFFEKLQTPVRFVSIGERLVLVADQDPVYKVAISMQGGWVDVVLVYSHKPVNSYQAALFARLLRTLGLADRAGH